MSPQAFDQQDRACRGQALRATGDQRISLYVDCMQQYGNIMHGSDGRVIASQRAKADGASGQSNSGGPSDAEQIEAIVDAQARANRGKVSVPSAPASMPGVSDQAASEYEAGLKAKADRDPLKAKDHLQEALRLGDVRAAGPYCDLIGAMKAGGSPDKCMQYALGKALKRQPSTAEVQEALTPLLANNAARPKQVAATPTAAAAEPDTASADREAKREKMRNDPNHVTLFGITIGEPLDLPACKKLDTGRVARGSEPCLYNMSGSNIVRLPEQQVSNFPWLGDVSRRIGGLVGGLMAMGGGLGEMIVTQDSSGKVVMLEMVSPDESYESSVVESFTRKFGAAVSRTTQTYGNDNGARRTSPVITWRKSGVRAVLEYAGTVTNPYVSISVMDERTLEKAKNSKRAKEAM